MKNNASRIRLFVVFALVTLVWAVLVVRLAQIQIANGREYGEIAARQSTGKSELQAQRGVIYDRAGREVAINVYRNALYAYPTGSREIKRLGAYLDKLYGYANGTARKKFSLTSSRFTWIDRDLNDQQSNRLLRDSIPGLYIRRELKRDYPFGTIGQQLLGCTDIDGRGISGLEFGYDSLLAGRPGLIDYLRDGQRNTYRIREVPVVPTIPGNSVILTIDWYLQEIVEEELKAAVEKHHALDGTALFVDVKTGEILAAADYTAGGNQDAVKLRAAGNCFEPGSVFKIFTSAALLDESLVEFDEKIYCEQGAWRCGRRTLRDDKKLDSLVFQEIFELSSNIGIAKLAQRLGGDKLRETARKFGFSQKPYAGLPGEASGAIGNPGKWSEYNIAALAMGHSISVTSLQLAAAISAVANGGTLYRPYIVRGVINSEGDLIRKNRTQKVARVMKEKSAEILHEFMKGVVERGTAKPAKSDIIALAGKTGTAEIPDLVNGGYKKNKFIATFGGFFPADDPRIAGVVVINQPEPIHYGGYTSGPAFKNIAERYAVAHSEYLLPGAQLIAGDMDDQIREVPNFVGCDLAFARKIAEKKGITLSTDRDEGIIEWQYPPSSRQYVGDGRVAVLVADSSATMADLTGLNLRTALSVLTQQGLAFEIVGSGFVKRQYPRAGTAVNKQTRCRLVCGVG